MSYLEELEYERKMSDEIIETFKRLFHTECYRDIYSVTFNDDEIVINHDTHYGKGWTVFEAMQDYVSYKSYCEDLDFTYRCYAD